MRTENPGDYRDRITICKRNLDKTDTGQEYENEPTPLKTLSALVNTLSPSEREAAARENVRYDITFKIRYGKMIDDIILNPQEYVVLFKGVYFEIKYTDDFKYKHDRIKLFCEKEIGGNNG